jgi:hypothetical protein
MIETEILVRAIYHGAGEVRREPGRLKASSQRWSFDVLALLLGESGSEQGV